MRISYKENKRGKGFSTVTQVLSMFDLINIHLLLSTVFLLISFTEISIQEKQGGTGIAGQILPCLSISILVYHYRGMISISNFWVFIFIY